MLTKARIGLWERLFNLKRYKNLAQTLTTAYVRECESYIFHLVKPFVGQMAATSRVQSRTHKAPAPQSRHGSRKRARLTPLRPGFDFHPDRNVANFIFKPCSLICLQEPPSEFWRKSEHFWRVFTVCAVGHFWYHHSVTPLTMTPVFSGARHLMLSH